MSDKGMSLDLRHLRGDELAQHLVALNGHQRPLRFLIFEPYWAPMLILPIPFMSMLPFLKTVGAAALIGIAFEAALWCFYAIRHKSPTAYPGLHVAVRIFLRTYLTPTGRPGSPISRP